jgi:hypothetical protein
MLQGRTIMSHAFRATVMIAAAAGALSGMAGERLYAQGADPNAAPNPYKMQEPPPPRPPKPPPPPPAA